MGSSAALAMGHVREVAGTGSAILGFSQFALGAVVSPLVGLSGESSAVAPAIVMAVCSLRLCSPYGRVRRHRPTSPSRQVRDHPAGTSTSVPSAARARRALRRHVCGVLQTNQVTASSCDTRFSAAACIQSATAPSA